jgi:two-component system, NarL family, response regulator
METAPVRVLIVDDHAQTRAGVRDYLLAQSFVVREASNTADGLQLVQTWQPHVVVLDIVLPPRHGEPVNLVQGDGVRAARLIKEYDAHIGIVMLSAHPYYQSELLALVQEGYGGLVYLFKGESPAHELRQAIHDALDGRIAFDPQVSRSPRQQPTPLSHTLTDQERERVEFTVAQMTLLTERELEVVSHAAASKTNGGIAKALFITPNAVQTHLRNIYAKVGLGHTDRLLDKRSLLAKAYAIYRSRPTPRQRSN